MTDPRASGQDRPPDKQTTHVTATFNLQSQSQSPHQRSNPEYVLMEPQDQELREGRPEALQDP